MERSRTHPILLAAGAAVLLFSLLGATALTGLLPVGNSEPVEFDALAEMVAAAAPAAHPSRSMAVVPCANCGVIESVRAVEANGRGNEIARNLNWHAVWRVAVRLDDGSLRTLSQRTQPPFAVGDRVRIVDGDVERA
jgi:hypothetical protein